MAWDFLRDPLTGDWIFAGNRDYSGATGEILIQQRVSINLKIPRGQFVYDTDKSLGSRLYDLLRTDFDRGLRDAPDIVREALDGMTDISIDEIQVMPNKGNPRELNIKIVYHALVPTDFATVPAESGIVNVPFSIQSADLFPPEPA